MTTESPVCPDTEIWEPMETAPLDGTPVRVRKDDIQATVSWSDDVHTWVIGLATEPNLPDRILPWHPTSWAPGSGSVENALLMTGPLNPHTYPNQINS